MYRILSILARFQSASVQLLTLYIVYRNFEPEVTSIFAPTIALSILIGQFLSGGLSRMILVQRISNFNESNVKSIGSSYAINVVLVLAGIYVLSCTDIGIDKGMLLGAFFGGLGFSILIFTCEILRSLSKRILPNLLERSVIYVMPFFSLYVLSSLNPSLKIGLSILFVAAILFLIIFLIDELFNSLTRESLQLNCSLKLYLQDLIVSVFQLGESAVFRLPIAISPVFLETKYVTEISIIVPITSAIFILYDSLATSYIDHAYSFKITSSKVRLLNLLAVNRSFFISWLALVIGIFVLGPSSVNQLDLPFETLFGLYFLSASVLPLFLSGPSIYTIQSLESGFFRVFTINMFSILFFIFFNLMFFPSGTTKTYLIAICSMQLYRSLCFLGLKMQQLAKMMKV